MDEYTTIPLSKRGKKNAGLFEAIIDSKNKDLAEFAWAVKNSDKHNTQYAYRMEYAGKGKQKRIWLHRIILEIKLGHSLPNEVLVDHIDGNGLNCREDNLRVATNGQNQHNSRKHRDNKSGIKGVYWVTSEKKWRASIKVDGVLIHLGNFTEKDEAKRAYNEASERYHKEFSHHD